MGYRITPTKEIIMQVKILKDYKEYKKGEYVSIPVKKAIQLIRTGFAIAHKAIFTGVQK